MSVKFIKLWTGLNGNTKIKMIRSRFPGMEGDSIVMTWIDLLIMAGNCNDDGRVYMIEGVPLDNEDLSHIMGREAAIVATSMDLFSKYRMTEQDEDGVTAIKNWGKYQSVEGLEKIREQTKKRVTEHRQRKRNATSNVTETDKERDIDKDIDKDKEKHIKPAGKTPAIPYAEIVDYLNQVCKTKYKATSKETQRLIKARIDAGFNMDDFKTVISKKGAQWLNDPENSMYLRPETLFGTKFESYLNQPWPKGKGPRGGGNDGKPGNKSGADYSQFLD